MMEVVAIDRDKGLVTLRLNGMLYSNNAVVRASKDFSENFWVAIQGNENGTMEISLKPKPKFANGVDLNILGYEFCNYALGLMQEAS